MAKELKRRPAVPAVNMYEEHNSIGRRTGVVFHKRVDAGSFFTSYLGVAGGFKLGFLVIAQWWMMGYLIGGWTFLTSVPVVIGAVAYYLHVNNVIPQGRKFKTTDLYYNMPDGTQIFLDLYKLQSEVRQYILNNNVADFYVERYNELAEVTNKLWDTFTTNGLTEREDAMLMDRLKREAPTLRRDFDGIYSDMLKQVEHDPSNTVLGRALTTIDELGPAKKEREEDYRELNRVYLNYMDPDKGLKELEN